MAKTTVRRKRSARRKPPPAEVEDVKKATAASKPARRRKAEPVAKPAPKPEPVVEESDGDYDQWGMRELRDELKERELATRGNKAKLIMRLLADDNGEENAESEPAKPARRKAKAVPEPEEEDVGDEDGLGLSMEGSMAEFLESVGTGQSIVATRIDEDTWQFAIGDAVAAAVAVPVGMGLKGMAYKKEVLSEEYWQHNYEDAGDGKGWKKMTVEEKYAFADELGVAWEESEDPKVDMMRCVKAVYLELGIAKYKPEYQTTATRNAVR